MKHISNVLISFLLLISVSHGIESAPNGYKGVSWGTSKTDVSKKLPTKKDPFVHCNEIRNGFEIDNYHSSFAESMHKQFGTFLPGMSFGSGDNSKAPIAHLNSFTQKKVGDGCGVFFNKKFIAFYLTFHGFEPTKKLIEEKYGSFQKSEGGILSPTYYYFDSPSTVIVLFENRVKSGGSFANVYYFSKLHSKEMSENLTNSKKIQNDQITKQQKQLLQDRKNNL